MPKTNRSKKKENDLTKDLNPDSLAVEAVKEYQLKMGKWRTHALSTLEDSLFEVAIRVMNKCRNSVMHLSYFLKSKISKSDLSMFGNHLTQLATGKAAQIFEDFTTFLCNLYSICLFGNVVTLLAFPLVSGGSDFCLKKGIK